MRFLRGQKSTEVRESCQTDGPIGITFGTNMLQLSRAKPGNPAKCYNKFNTGNTAFSIILFFKINLLHRNV